MISIEVWLYGPLAAHAGEESHGSYAQLRISLPTAARMGDLLERLSISVTEKGITFVNGELTDMPGLAADLARELHEGDRVGLFHPRSMWPFQYRFGASTSPELQAAMLRDDGGAIHHSHKKALT